MIGVYELSLTVSPISVEGLSLGCDVSLATGMWSHFMILMYILTLSPQYLFLGGSHCGQERYEEVEALTSLLAL